MNSLAISIKIVGLALLFIAFYLFGRSTALRCEDRPRELRLALAGLELLQAEIGYGFTKMGLALRHIAEALGTKCNGDLSYTRSSHVPGIFSRSADHLASGEGVTAGEAWDKAIRECGEESALTKRDIEVLLDVSDSLSAPSAADMVRRIQLSATALRMELEVAQVEADRMGRVYRTVWMAAGGCAVLLLA